MGNLEELRQTADQKFGVGTDCRVFVDLDGTEIEDDEYLSFVEADSKLMVTAREDTWTAEDTSRRGTVPCNKITNRFLPTYVSVASPTILIFISCNVL